VDNGFTTTVQIGTILGEIDVDADTVSGTIQANWFSDPLFAYCGVWEEGGINLDFMVDPDGGSYYCDFGAAGWDLQPGHDVGVQYQEPDGDWVNNVFREPAPYLTISKNARSEAGEGGNMTFYISYRNDGDAPAEDVTITDTMLGGLSYLGDTSGLPRTGDGSGPITWDVGTLEPNEGQFFVIYAEITGVESETITNTITISTSNPYDQGEPWEKESQWSGVIQAGDVHVNVGKWSYTPDPAPGHSFVFEVNVCNDGNTGSTVLTLTDRLHPDITLLDWSGLHPGWYEVERDLDHLTLAILSAPGHWCGQVLIEVDLDDNALPGETITNTAVITASNDLEPEDNEAYWEGQVGEPHLNVGVDKHENWGIHVPGGEINYNIRIDNNGNVPVTSTFKITDVLPVSTTFLGSFEYYDFGWHPITPTIETADYVVWEFDGLDNGFWRDFEVVLGVDPDTVPGTTLTNTAEIEALQDEDSYEDNISFSAVTIFDHGPNLRVQKWSDWDGDARIAYYVRFQNLGDEMVSNVWLTDTLPVGTTWDGWWDMEFDWERLITTTHSGDVLMWQFSELNPGEVGWLYFGANLDNPEDPLPEYSNLIQITLPPDDADPSDNEYLDIATPPPPPAVVEIAPAYAQLAVGETITVDVAITQVYDLYGAALEITFDPTLVEVEDADPGTPGVQIAVGSCPIPDLVAANDVDNAAGVINYAVSSLAPSSPCNGSGILASITFHGLVTGTSPVHISGLLLADSNGETIAADIFDGVIDVVDLGLIEGSVQLQSRSDHSGAQVCAWQGGLAVECTTTDSAGSYELWVSGGTYTVTVEDERFLDAEKSGVSVVAGSTTILSTVTLRGGDCIDDCIVNILDLSFMGARYLLS
jgi:uncharacterized repeat protein (TIGR01451 family)